MVKKPTKATTADKTRYKVNNRAPYGFKGVGRSYRKDCFIEVTDEEAIRKIASIESWYTDENGVSRKRFTLPNAEEFEEVMCEPPLKKFIVNVCNQHLNETVFKKDIVELLKTMNGDPANTLALAKSLLGVKELTSMRQFLEVPFLILKAAYEEQLSQVASLPQFIEEETEEVN